MFNESIGTFKGRTEDCNKFEAPSALVLNYLANVPKRAEDLKKIMNDKTKLLNSNPKMKEFVEKSYNELTKMKEMIEQNRLVQEQENKEQMTM